MAKSVIPEYKCIQCTTKLNAPSVDHLCTDCRKSIPKRDGLIDLTSLHRCIIQAKPFVDENGKEILGELPMRPLWDTPSPNELWAQAGMDKASKYRNRIAINDKKDQD